MNSLPCGRVSYEGLNHPAPLQRSIRHCSVCPWRAQQDSLLHVRSQTSHREDIQQIDGLVQRKADGNEVSVEPQRVTWGRTRHFRFNYRVWRLTDLETYLGTPGSLLQTSLLTSHRSPVPSGLWTPGTWRHDATQPVLRLASQPVGRPGPQGNRLAPPGLCSAARPAPTEGR